MKKVRIQADTNDISQVLVTDADTGEVIKGVARIQIDMLPQCIPQVTLTLIESEMDIVGERLPLHIIDAGSNDEGESK